VANEGPTASESHTERRTRKLNDERGGYKGENGVHCDSFENLLALSERAFILCCETLLRVQALQRSVRGPERRAAGHADGRPVSHARSSHHERIAVEKLAVPQNFQARQRVGNKGGRSFRVERTGEGVPPPPQHICCFVSATCPIRQTQDHKCSRMVIWASLEGRPASRPESMGTRKKSLFVTVGVPFNNVEKKPFGTND